MNTLNYKTLAREINLGQRPVHYRTVFNATEISKRYDGNYAVWVAVTQGDLDLVTPYQVQTAIQRNEPWRNPLMWVVAEVCSDRDEAVKVAQRIFAAGSAQDYTASARRQRSSISSLAALGKALDAGVSG